MKTMVRQATAQDEQRWSALRAELWPEDTAEAHARDIGRLFREGWPLPSAAFLAEQEGRPVGFIEVSVRPYAEECYSGSVGYIEGWYVVPDLRRSGIGRQLVEAGEAWARAQGCREMASDAALDNAGSTTAHEALGYLSVAEIRCFRKEL